MIGARTDNPRREGHSDALEAAERICREQIEEWEGEDPRAAAKACADEIARFAGQFRSTPPQCAEIAVRDGEPTDAEMHAHEASFQKKPDTVVGLMYAERLREYSVLMRSQLMPTKVTRDLIASALDLLADTVEYNRRGLVFRTDKAEFIPEE